MIKFYAGKTIQYTILILLTVTLNFMLPRIMPGDPLKYIIGEDIVYMSVEEVNEKRVELGLDQPIIAQYGDYLSGMVRGDFGYSYQKKTAVSEIISRRIGYTLLLTGINLIISTVLGIFFGTLAAWRRGERTDLTLNNIFVFLRSMPSFWVGMVLVAIFGVQLKLLPSFGAESMGQSLEGFARLKDLVQHLILPVTALVILSVSQIYFTMRYSMINTLREDYIKMARLKGMPNKTIRYKHAMRNALIPVITVVMLNLGYMVGGTTIIETVFAYPGMGRLLFESVLSRDYQLIQGCVLIITLCVIFANLLADMLYPVIDPKVV